ncbi:MAG: nuclear transport factor 2 family protein [Actinomycetota bacterium]
MAESRGVERVREGFAAFERQDVDTVREGFAEDIVWHHPGANPLAGDYTGRDEVFGFLARVFQETGGTLRNDIHDIVGNDQHVVALINLSGERNGKKMDQKAANVFHVDDEGRVTERWLLVEDTPAFDDFWS